MTIKLMVPGEVSAVVAQPRFAYAGREDCPAGISGQGDAVEFEVELFDFEREGHWQVRVLGWWQGCVFGW